MNEHVIPDAQLYGLVAEFETADELLAAAHQMRRAGYTAVDAFSPHPVEGLDEALAIPRSRVPLIFLIGAIIGGLTGFGLQYYAAAIAYPWHIGGKPLNSWPMFIPITFELTILFAGVGGVIGMLALNGLPMPYHPVFKAPRFERASQDRYFICIESRDPRFDRVGSRMFLQSCGAKEVVEVAK